MGAPTGLEPALRHEFLKCTLSFLCDFLNIWLWSNDWEPSDQFVLIGCTKIVRRKLFLDPQTEVEMLLRPGQSSGKDIVAYSTFKGGFSGFMTRPLKVMPLANHHLQAVRIILSQQILSHFKTHRLVVFNFFNLLSCAVTMSIMAITSLSWVARLLINDYLKVGLEIVGKSREFSGRWLFLEILSSKISLPLYLFWFPIVTSTLKPAPGGFRYSGDKVITRDTQSSLSHVIDWLAETPIARNRGDTARSKHAKWRLWCGSGIIQFYHTV